MPMFWRNMLFPSSGLKAGKWRTFTGFEEGRLTYKDLSEIRTMGKRIQTNKKPSSRLKGGCW
jgi:hypothetical protein